MKTPTPGSVLVINAIHNAQTRSYRYETVEVSEETANIQLSKKEADRNPHWRGVRYANDEEIREFYGIPKQEAKKEIISKPSEVPVQEIINDVLQPTDKPETQPTREVKKPGRKPKAQTA